MDIKIKKIGTREDVYKGNALRTGGGLKKEDIIEKCIGLKTIYISKKLSDKMKINISILRAHNPNFINKMHKKTMVCANTLPIEKNIKKINNQTSNQTSNPTSNPKETFKKHTFSKTQKLSFKINDNTMRTIFYPELQGIDLKELKDELQQEEANEDLGITKKTDNIFTIEDVPDIDINSLF